MDPSRQSLPTRAVLARIRCLQESIECYRNSTPMPEALCYVPGTIEYKLSRTTISKSPTKFPVYKKTDKNGGKTTVNIGEEASCGVVVSGLEMCNCHGQWIKLEKGGLTTKDPSHKNVEGWLLLYDRSANPDDPPWLVKVEPQMKSNTNQRLFGKQQVPITRWEEAIEAAYSLRVGIRPPATLPTSPQATDALRKVPPNWTLESDEELARFLYEHMEQDNENLGSVKQFVESVDVSSCGEDDSASCLTDGDSSTYWESDGTQGQHWIRLRMKKGTVIKKLYITIDAQDENFLPSQIIVMVGEIDNLEKLNDMNIDTSVTGDICILEDMTRHYRTIEIRIKACRDEGIDCRIHGIKIKSSKQRDLGLNRDIFSTEELVRYPRLELVEKELLYRRALVLQRFVRLLDSVLHYIVPAWEYSVGSFSSLEVVRQFLPLSKKRNALAEHFLRQSETVRPHQLPKLYINRRSAADHRADPSQDPLCKSTIFTQVYEGLKPKDRNNKALDYRWPARYDQWWECKFLSEGIIDQGGGFRDSLSDVAEELCPTDSEQPVPLPFFVRSPNQKHDNSNVYRDTYIPNPSCELYAKYEWIGMIMGACLRSKEHLVLALPSFVWKLLAGERVTWSRDYLTVDAAAVKLTETIEKMDKETFTAHFADELTYTTVLSDHRLVDLKNNGSGVKVQYEERMEFCQLMQEARTQESSAQVASIRKGLLRVVPQAVLDLLTWQELEKKICGDPEISVDALKKTTFYEDIEQSDIRVNYLWEALTNFTNEDRSRFLRFVTGRRRLPAPLYVCLDRGDKVDSLPESSTCSNTLFLPNYSSAKVAEEKLRYAAYNCVAIDTDMSPWDE
ncbi:E3 ubiquitin-protein ligase HECTD3-like isoform X2 [Amphiura filiformis]|uniref:E3 ubiquitin-protein ligase HECTD3-like isoform X1 n=1 Tax=Amphiura filiformis TaxID=82378 RepID=UPI003B20E5C7